MPTTKSPNASSGSGSNAGFSLMSSLKGGAAGSVVSGASDADSTARLREGLINNNNNGTAQQQQ